MSQDAERDPADSIVEPETLGEGGPGGGSGGRGRTRWRRVALWCALAGVIAGVVGVVALRDPAPSPAEELARVRQFVAAAGTGRFQGEARSESGRGPDQPGSTSIDVARIEGSFHLPDRLRFVEDDGDYVSEGVLVGRAAYFRSAESGADLQSEPWEYEELPEQGAASSEGSETAVDRLDEAGATALTTASGLFGAWGAPFDLVELLGRIDGVERVSSGVLEARLTWRDLVPPEMVAEVERASAEAEAEGEAEDEIGTELLDDPVVVRLVHDDGRLDEMVVTTESTDDEDERTVDRTSMRFSAWGSPVEIAAPSRADVDLTPGVDEHALASFGEFPVLAPRSVPPGWVLESASVEEEDAENELCASVELDYGPPSPASISELALAPSLHLRLTAASCPWAASETAWDSGGSAETVRIGAYEARVRRSPGPTGRDGAPALHLRFEVGGVVVQAHANLPQDQLVAVLATLGPLDLASQPVAREEPPPGG